jgi:glycosyltransferase involved in cell wall biosynthesis
MTPTLSVIIPAYQDPYRLGFVLEALSRQQSSDYQIMIIDGGEVQVKDLIAEFKSYMNLEYYPLPKPVQNPSLTRNYGVVRAKAPRILFLDQDCVPAPDVLAEHAQYKDESIIVVGFRTFVHQDSLCNLTLDDLYNDGRFHYAADMRYDWFFRRRGVQPNQRLIYFFGSVYTCHASVPTALVRKVGGFDEAIDTWGSEDFELGTKLGRAGCFLILRPDLTVYHMDHPFRPRRYELLENRIDPTVNSSKMRFTEPLVRTYNPTEERLHFWGKEHNGLAVITVITKSGGYTDFFLQSCQRHEIKPIVLGQGTRWRGFGTKLNLLYYYLKQIELPPFMLLVDGFDSVFQSYLQEIWESYKTFHSPIVFAADPGCWPDETLRNKFPTSSTVFRYLNAGGYIGETKAIIRMLEQIGCPLPDEASSEQALLSRYFLSHPREIRLDYETRIFHSLYRTADTVKFSPEYQCFVNAKFGYRPHILHLNGDVDSEPYASNLGYNIIAYRRKTHNVLGTDT